MYREPEGDVILRTEIPPPCPPNVDKGYWDAMVRRLAILHEDEALRISFPGDQVTSSMKSSLFTAAGRAGRRVTILVRGACLYAWLCGEREPKRYLPPRPSFPCEVCGREIIPPKSLMRASSTGSPGGGSAPRKASPLPGYSYNPPDPVVEARPAAKELPASFTNWAIAAGVLVLALAGWGWHNATATRSLHVESYPPGAEVRVDGKVLGRTALTAEVKASAREVVLDLPFHDRETIQLDPNNNPAKVTLRLWKDYTYVVSEPPNAEVYVDGEPKGPTPLYGLELPGAARRQQLVLKKDGYRTWSGTLEHGRPLTSPIPLAKASLSGDSGQ